MKLTAAILAAMGFFAGLLDAGQFGTGFAISPKGYFVTCHHVIRGADRIIIHTPRGPLPAIIVALDPGNDLAILKVERWDGEFLGLGRDIEANYASEVIAAGFPDPTVLGRNPKVSKGIVSSLSGVRDDPRFLQISAPVQPGNSGGPVISESGRVIGVVAAGLNSIDRMTRGGYLPQSVNYAIKADLILPLLHTASVSVPRFGTRTQNEAKKVERALLSIALVEGLDAERGAHLTALPPLRPGPWIFPNSNARPLSAGEVQRLSPEGLWRARNEIYLRHGFVFSTPRGREFASQFGTAYRPMTREVSDVHGRLNPVEIANLQLIASYETAGS